MQYAMRSVVNLLPQICLSNGNLLRTHQRFLAKILLRPIRDVMLTHSVIAAFQVAGDRRGLAYVRSLGLDYERDIAAWNRSDAVDETVEEREHREYLDRLRNELDADYKGPGSGAKSVVRSFSEFLGDEEYVPRLGHLDNDGRYVPPPEFCAAQAEELGHILSAARECEAAMEARLRQEEQALTLLHPAAAPADELLRSAEDVKSAVADLLRPDTMP